MPINWCPKCKIGLANEEVVAGNCERCGTPTEKKEKEQWMLAITKYADRLDQDLDSVDYLEKIKTQQKNWIGRNEGYTFSFTLLVPGQGEKHKVEVFTTRLDTLGGVTYVAISPELAKKWLGVGWKAGAEVQKYIKETLGRREDAEETKEKTGVKTDIIALHPLTNKELPVFVSNYVLGSVGTGALMGVPAHDERDFAFAKQYDIPITQVIEPFYTQTTEPGKVREGIPYDHRDAIIAIVKHWSEDKYLALKWKQVAWGTFITGGIEPGQTAEQAAKMEIREETGYLSPTLVEDFGKVHGLFYHVPKQINRFAHAQVLLFQLTDDARQDVLEEEKARHEILWLTAKELQKFLTPDTHQHALRLLLGTQGPYTGAGILTSSGIFDGLESEEAKIKIAGAVCAKKTTTYKLRDWVFSRQRYWGEPIPMVHCEKHGWVPVPEKDLPLTLPKVKRYQPTDTGESPLAAIEKWVKTKCPVCKGPARRETDVMPNWAGSSWYYLRYTDPKNTKAFAGKKELKYWTPVDWYNGGMEHTVLHLLYSRFWHKFLYDQKLVPTEEPYMKRTSHGLILAEDGSKMSKSKGNVVNPDVYLKPVGADTLRVYEMFMGPFDQEIAWNTNSVAGSRRFLERVWKLSEKTIPSKNSNDRILVHRTIKKITEDIEELKMNTAIASLMILLNHLEKEPSVTTHDFYVLLRLLAPFAPHITEELFAIVFKKKTSIHQEPWPQFNPKEILSDTITLGVQVNGKTRGSIVLSREASEHEAVLIAESNPEVKKWLTTSPKKIIYLPGKILSFVL